MQIPHKNNRQALSFLKCGKNCDRNYFFCFQVLLWKPFHLCRHFLKVDHLPLGLQKRVQNGGMVLLSNTAHSYTMQLSLVFAGNMITWLPAISPCYYVATWICISMLALQLYGYKQVAVSPCGYVVGKVHSQIKPVLV